MAVGSVQRNISQGASSSSSLQIMKKRNRQESSNEVLEVDSRRVLPNEEDFNKSLNEIFVQINDVAQMVCLTKDSKYQI
jgi:hypothetical protein